MSMSITPAELVLYVEFVAAVHDHHRRDPSERETLHSVAKMMLADSTRAIQENSGELETSLTRVKEIMALIEPHSANGSRFSDALMELVVSHGSGARLGCCMRLRTRSCRTKALEQRSRRQKLGWHRSFCLPRSIELHPASSDLRGLNWTRGGHGENLCGLGGATAAALQF
jgi:hypothetical protein